MTETMIPVFKGSSLEALLIQLGNTGVQVDDKYSIEYLVYSAFLTTIQQGRVVAKPYGNAAGRPLLGGPGNPHTGHGRAWIQVVTPSEGQPVGVFLLNAPV